MRRIVQLLEARPDHRLSRAELETVLVKGDEGFYSSNVLRSIRALAREHRVSFRDARHKADAVVSLPRKVQAVPESTLDALLAELNEEAGS